MAYYTENEVFHINKNPFIDMEHEISIFAKSISKNPEQTILMILAPIEFTVKELGIEELLPISIPDIGEWIDTKLAQEAVIKLMQEFLKMVQ